MKTKILKFEEGRMKEIIEESVKVIKNGGIIIYPTETSYGIGADAMNVDAIKKIREIKGRAYDKPITVIVDSIETMEKYGKINKKVEKLVKKFMPGPLTIVVEKKNLPNVLSQEGIGFRLSSHPVVMSINDIFKKPITARSANISGEGNIYDSKKLIELFDGKADLIIDYGEIPVVKPSTIIDMRNEPIIIREGPVPARLVLSEL